MHSLERGKEDVRDERFLKQQRRATWSRIAYYSSRALEDDIEQRWKVRNEQGEEQNPPIANGMMTRKMQMAWPRRSWVRCIQKRPGGRHVCRLGGPLETLKTAAPKRRKEKREWQTAGV